MPSDRTLVTLGLATLSLSCAPVRSQGGDPSDPLALVERLVDSRPFTRRSVETATPMSEDVIATSSSPSSWAPTAGMSCRAWTAAFTKKDMKPSLMPCLREKSS